MLWFQQDAIQFWQMYIFVRNIFVRWFCYRSGHVHLRNCLSCITGKHNKLMHHHCTCIRCLVPCPYIFFLFYVQYIVIIAWPKYRYLDWRFVPHVNKIYKNNDIMASYWQRFAMKSNSKSIFETRERGQLLFCYYLVFFLKLTSYVVCFEERVSTSTK